MGGGGGGKTTLASSVYDQISINFDGCCFLSNIREESSIRNGLENLQAEIVSGVLKQKQVEVKRVEEGRHMIRDRLRHKKVLIVLDDVDNLRHLKELAGSRDWFGEGSRIIITTRDEHVLTAHKVDVIHNIRLLKDDEAMRLFCKHAPPGSMPIRDYEVLSKDVVSYAGGLPLALRVLGCFLCDKQVNEWRSALARLKEIPETDILDMLKISFDGLKPVERELFLDIACFFKGGFQDDEKMRTLDACGFHPVIGIKVLVQKALITINENGRFDMHDLVEEMAHYIVRGKHPKNPEKHSRVWKKGDVLKICAMDATTNLDGIEAIIIWSKNSVESERLLQGVANMKKLRWIDFICHYHPLIIMPESFPPRELCCLDLEWLNAKQLWEGYKHLPNLRRIKLDGLKSLTKTPDFDGLPNLETFVIRGCPLLEEIDPSFGRLENLVYVEIRRCENLKMLPPITRAMKLETFRILECKFINKVSKIQESKENRVPHNMNHTGLWFISERLTKLDLSHCDLTDGDMIRCGADWELPNLQQLNLSKNRFVRLNFGLLRLPRLKWLDVSRCRELVDLSELPSSIAVLKADDCGSLESFGDISNCKWLWKVSLSVANKLGPFGGDILLDSMLQGNARDYFISIFIKGINDSLSWHSVLLPWVDLVKTYNIQLPDDWYINFSGISMFVTSDRDYVGTIKISIKQQVLDKDFQSQLWQEDSNQTPHTPSDDTSSMESNESYDFDHTFLGYVSFSSLRHTGCFNSTYNMLSFSFEDEDSYRVWWYRFKAVLVPKDGLMHTTNVTTDDFWDEKEVYKKKTFTIQHDPNSSVDILWEPPRHSIF